MKKLWINKNFQYSGEQLSSLYAYLNHKVLGDSIVAWAGPCNVSLEHMVDGEDLLEQAKIESDNMLHFIIEKFDSSLLFMTCLQRLLAEIVISEIQKLSANGLSASLIRKGDDIYSGDKKLNISIATCSPSSCLLHFGINIGNEGTPVETCALSDFKIEPKAFAEAIMAKVVSEVEGLTRATQKVKWVK